MKLQLYDLVVDTVGLLRATVFGSTSEGESVGIKITDFAAKVHLRVPVQGINPIDLQDFINKRVPENQRIIVRAVWMSNLVNFRGKMKNYKSHLAKFRYFEIRFFHSRTLGRLKSMFPTTNLGLRRNRGIGDMSRLLSDMQCTADSTCLEDFTLHGDLRTVKVQLLVHLRTSMRGWIEVLDDVIVCGPAFGIISRHCGMAASCKITPITCESVSPFTVAAIDIETHSRRRGGDHGRRGFSRSHVPGDHVIAVALAFAPFGTEDQIRTKTCLFLGPVDHPHAEMCPTESHLLSRLQQTIVDEDTCWISGYNSDKFDWYYLAARATLINFFNGSRDNVRYWTSVRSKVLQYDELSIKYDESFRIGRVHNHRHQRCHCCACIVGSMKRLLGDNSYGSRRPCVPLVDRLLAEYTTKEELLEAHKYFGDQDVTSFFELHRFAGMKTSLRQVSLSTSAFGDNVMQQLHMHGRVNQDLYMYMKTTFKFNSFKLKAVCKELLPSEGQKKDLGYQEMFVAWEALEHAKNAEERKTAIASRSHIVDYNIQDAVVVLMLLYKAAVCVAMVEQANVCHVSPQDIASRGQQIRVFSQLYRECHDADIVINRYQLNKPDTYKGATVLPPSPGYYSEFVATLDFASLYPSIIMARNICFSTYIGVHDVRLPIPRTIKYHLSLVARKCMPPLVTIEIKTDAPHNVVTHRIYFVARTVHHGILPRLVQKLLQARKKVKIQMKAARDSQTRRILNERQKGIKISANSAYGFTGTQRGFLSFWVVAAAITACGRTMIDDTRKAVVEFGLPKHVTASVIYGDTDSVMVKLSGLPSSEEGLIEAFQHANILAKHVTDKTFRAYPAIILEAEDVAWGFQIWATRKRYIKRIFETPMQAVPKITSKGVESARRDQPGVLLTLYKRLTTAMFPPTRTPPLTVSQLWKTSYPILCKSLEAIVHDRIPLEEYVVSKELSASYKYPDRLGHVQVTKKRALRVANGDDPRPPPEIGERVQTVQIVVLDPKHGSKGKRIGNASKAEDPWWIQRHSDACIVDRTHYVKSLRQPISKLLFFTGAGPQLNRMFTAAERYLESTLGCKRAGTERLFITRQRPFKGPSYSAGDEKVKRTKELLVTSMFVPLRQVPPPPTPMASKPKRKRKRIVGQRSITDFMNRV